ncbi:MAG: 50S ribosomal protein L11 methyltransferase [Armatimonadetes bacterium]|nr:50S ribosomal protein L11 methyltransferase [Armatimonadota bacterium]MCX7968525.1 50S ribosomal protein L11 methyltransferase [Armatimonadota bacterium]MDW8143028.1 50S ribosomal protein L11 methyltransferase [Armatimonadota bacterium]
MFAWLEITVTTDSVNAEQVHGLLDTLGCLGTAQVWKLEPDSGEQQVTTQLVGYLPATEDVTEKLIWLQEQIDYALAHGWLFKPVTVTTRILESEEWEGPLREVLPPLLIGDKFLITLTDSEVDNPENRIVLRLRSLGGFGTGHHPTTKMCLEFLEKAMVAVDREVESHQTKGRRVLDVGTGSGILAIAAAKLGAKEVIATDIDDAALEAAKENAKRNEVEGKIKFVKSDLLRQVKGQFDIVLSNLLTPLIKDLAWQLKSREVLTQDSLWIASGVSSEGWKEVKPLLAKLGYRIIDECELAGWVAFKAELC